MELFVQLSLVIVVAVAISFIMRTLRQPLLIGYILTGIFVGPYFLNLVHASETVGVFSQIGVALLLFTVGLHLNPSVIREVGKVSLITGIGQVLFTSVIGFALALMLGFSPLASFYIAIALTFSSTIIIMKLLSDKGDLDTVYGKIAVGFLIVQDLIAIVALMVISALSSGETLTTLVTETLFNGILAILALVAVSTFILPRITRYAARSQEFLFLFSIGWCLILASLFHELKFSLEIGALFAGMALSVSPYVNEISSKMRPLRDFFIVLFFIVIGSQMVFGDVMNHWGTILLFSAFILLGNPLIVLAIMGVMGFTKRTGFLAGLTVAQISEFSIILVTLGVSVGHLPSEVLSVVTMVGLITIAGSTYMINYANPLYNFLSPYLRVFEREKARKGDKNLLRKNYDAILFGYNRIGFSILKSFDTIKKKYLVVDYNPEVITALSRHNISCLYGDTYDSELLDELPLKKVKLIVSTIPEVETNELLINKIKEVNKNAIIIVRAHQIKDAMHLYSVGATYVLTPHFLGGEYVSQMIQDMHMNRAKYDKERHHHIKMLKERFNMGHDHPDIEKN